MYLCSSRFLCPGLRPARVRSDGYILARRLAEVLLDTGDKDSSWWGGWLQVLTELRNRGVKDIFIACVDRLKGFPQAIEAMFPQAQVQLCIVHMVRASLNFVSWKERKQVAQDLKSIYRAATEQQARQEMTVFAERWNQKYPTIAAMWQRNWDRVTPFFAFPAEVRTVIYTTNAVESRRK